MIKAQKTVTAKTRGHIRRSGFNPPASPICHFLFFIFYSLFIPAPADAAPLRQRLLKVERLINQWRELEAEKAMSPLVAAYPRHNAVKVLHAEVLFRKGEYAAALAMLKEAARRDPTSLQVKAARDLVAATLATFKGRKAHDSPRKHFRIWTTPGKDELLASFAGETLEAIRDALRQDLGYAPPDTIRVEFYSRPEDLARVSGLTLQDIKTSGTIALCKYNRLMVVTPRALPRGYSWRDTLAHEYVHLVVSRLSHNTVPIWLHEGLAKYFERRWRAPAGASMKLPPSMRHLLAEAQRTKRFITWARMHPSMAKLPSQEATSLAFAQVHTAVDYMASVAGLAGLRRLVTRMRQGRSDWQAVAEVTKMTEARFTRAWKRHLRSRNLRPLPGIVPPRRSFKKRPTREQRLAAIKHKKARDFMRLAGMLRQKSLTRAAVVEYLKARALLGQRNDLVANSMARAYLDLSSPAQAISALLPVLEYYPELPGPQVTLGVAYLRSGDLRAAATHLNAGLNINPFNPEVHCGLARALRKSDTKRAGRHASLCAWLSGRGRGSAPSSPSYQDEDED